MRFLNSSDISLNRHGGSQQPTGSSACKSLVIAAVVIIGTVAIFHETVASIISIWSGSDLFGHGFLVVPVVLWLMWKRWRRVLSVVPRPALVSGLLFVAAMAFVWLIGEIADVNLVRQFALVGMVPGIILAVLGWGTLRVLAFPLGYLFWAVPFGAFMVAPLQDVTAGFVVRALQMTGIPVFVDGIFLQIPTGKFLVAEACSGTRFLISTLAIGVLIANLFFRSWSRRVAFMALAVVVPIIANGIRAYAIVIVAHFVNREFAASADHITFGLIFMSIVTIFLLLIGLSFRERSMHEYDIDVGSADLIPKEHASVGPAAAAAGISALTLVLGAVLYSEHVQPTEGMIRVAKLRAPQVQPPWQLSDSDLVMWKPVFVGVDREIIQSYRNEYRSVVYYVGFYDYQRKGAELINTKNGVTGQAWGRAGSGRSPAHVDGRPLTVNYTRLLPERYNGNAVEAQGRMVWYWYWVDGRFTADPVWAKVFEVKAILFGGGQAAAVVAVAADYKDMPSEAGDTLKDFLKHLEPIGPILGNTSDSVTLPATADRVYGVIPQQAG